MSHASKFGQSSKSKASWLSTEQMPIDSYFGSPSAAPKKRLPKENKGRGVTTRPTAGAKRKGGAEGDGPAKRFKETLEEPGNDAVSVGRATSSKVPYGSSQVQREGRVRKILGNVTTSHQDQAQRDIERTKGLESSKPIPPINSRTSHQSKPVTLKYDTAVVDIDGNDRPVESSFRLPSVSSSTFSVKAYVGLTPARRILWSPPDLCPLPTPPSSTLGGRHRLDYDRLVDTTEHNLSYSFSTPLKLGDDGRKERPDGQFRQPSALSQHDYPTPLTGRSQRTKPTGVSKSGTGRLIFKESAEKTTCGKEDASSSSSDIASEPNELLRPSPSLSDAEQRFKRISMNTREVPSSQSQYYPSIGQPLDHVSAYHADEVPSSQSQYILPYVPSPKKRRPGIHPLSAPACDRGNAIPTSQSDEIELSRSAFRSESGHSSLRSTISDTSYGYATNGRNLPSHVPPPKKRRPGIHPLSAPACDRGDAIPTSQSDEIELSRSAFRSESGHSSLRSIISDTSYGYATNGRNLPTSKNNSRSSDHTPANRHVMNLPFHTERQFSEDLYTSPFRIPRDVIAASTTQRSSSGSNGTLPTRVCDREPIFDQKSTLLEESVAIPSSTDDRLAVDMPRSRCAEDDSSSDDVADSTMLARGRALDRASSVTQPDSDPDEPFSVPVVEVKRPVAASGSVFTCGQLLTQSDFGQEEPFTMTVREAKGRAVESGSGFIPRQLLHSDTPSSVTQHKTNEEYLAALSEYTRVSGPVFNRSPTSNAVLPINSQSSVPEADVNTQSSVTQPDPDYEDFTACVISAIAMTASPVRGPFLTASHFNTQSSATQPDSDDGVCSQVAAEIRTRLSNNTQSSVTSSNSDDDFRKLMATENEKRTPVSYEPQDADLLGSLPAVARDFLDIFKGDGSLPDDFHESWM